MNLVTGANGHLGNNLIRALLNNSEKVRASVRNIENKTPFEGLNVDIVYGDLEDKESLCDAMKDITTLYHCAYVFKHYAKDPQKEIIDINLQGTKNVLEAAAEQKVKKVIFVSSLAALDFQIVPLNDKSWNHDYSDPYYHAKTESEKLAWAYKEKLNLPLITVLPGSMVGPNIFNHLTPTMSLLNDIVHNKQSIDPCLNFNIIGINDVVQGMIAAAKKGKIGERYLLGSEKSFNTSEIIRIAQSLYPDLKIPKQISKSLLKLMVFMMKIKSKISGKPPKVVNAQINYFYKRDLSADISKTINDLDWHPKSPDEAIKETLIYLKNNPQFNKEG